jgi:hypothetical protein
MDRVCVLEQECVALMKIGHVWVANCTLALIDENDAVI